MEHPAWPAVETIRFPSTPGRARARRLLLEQLRQALAAEPATLEAVPDLSEASISGIRGRVSIVIGTLVVRLNREGFSDSERIYNIRDGLASGRPVDPGDLEWLDGAIASERSRASAG